MQNIQKKIVFTVVLLTVIAINSNILLSLFSENGQITSRTAITQLAFGEGYSNYNSNSNGNNNGNSNTNSNENSNGRITTSSSLSRSSNNMKVIISE